MAIRHPKLTTDQATLDHMAEAIRAAIVGTRGLLLSRDQYLELQAVREGLIRSLVDAGYDIEPAKAPR